MFIGVCVGEAWSLQFPNWPVLLTVPCLMSAVPCAFAPIPFAMLGIVEMSFVLGGPMAAPACVVAPLPGGGAIAASGPLRKNTRGGAPGLTLATASSRRGLDDRRHLSRFVATFVAFATNCGVGIIQRVVERSIRQAIRPPPHQRTASAAASGPVTAALHTAADVREGLLHTQM